MRTAADMVFELQRMFSERFVPQEDVLLRLAAIERRGVDVSLRAAFDNDVMHADMIRVSFDRCPNRLDATVPLPAGTLAFTAN